MAAAVERGRPKRLLPLTLVPVKNRTGKNIMVTGYCRPAITRLTKRLRKGFDLREPFRSPVSTGTKENPHAARPGSH
jgi:hypothetical protein